MSYVMPTPETQRLNDKTDKGPTATEPSTDTLRAYQRVQERIEQTFSDPRYEPPKLPAVALELLELARRPEVEVRDVVSLLEKDSILASQLLRHARSPLYAGSGEIRSLQKALMHLGLANIRDIAMELTVGARVFRAEHYAKAMDRVSQHSRLTAHLTQVICRHALYDASHAFLCGLLHDVGLAAGLIALGDVPRTEERPDIKVALPVLLEMHVDLGAQVAQSWGLAPEIVNVIRHHHQLTDPEGQVHNLAAVVCLAEYLANELGDGGIISRLDANQPQFRQAQASAQDHTDPQQIELACKSLGIDTHKMTMIRADATKVILNLEKAKSAPETSPSDELTPASSTSPLSRSTSNSGPQEEKGRTKNTPAIESSSGVWYRIRNLFGID